MNEIRAHKAGLECYPTGTLAGTTNGPSLWDRPRHHRQALAASTYQYGHLIRRQPTITKLVIEYYPRPASYSQKTGAHTGVSTSDNFSRQTPGEISTCLKKHCGCLGGEKTTKLAERARYEQASTPTVIHIPVFISPHHHPFFFECISADSSLLVTVAALLNPLPFLPTN